MSVNNAKDYNEQVLGVIQYLKSHNLSYNKALWVLSNVKCLLEQAIEQELKQLPLADGFEHALNPAHLKFCSKEIDREPLQLHQ